VLDEPTAGVDVSSQQSLADTLRTLVLRGVTIVLVAHELGPLGGLVDRTLVMRDGRVAYDGPPIDVFTDADPFHVHHGEPGRTADAHTPAVASPLDLTHGREEQP
jgi:zinc transport system ATP-binding protein